MLLRRYLQANLKTNHILPTRMIFWPVESRSQVAKGANSFLIILLERTII